LLDGGNGVSTSSEEGEHPKKATRINKIDNFGNFIYIIILGLELNRIESINFWRYNMFSFVKVIKTINNETNFFKKDML